MKKNFGDSTKANFNYKTTSVLKQFLLCRLMRDRQTLRKDKALRSDFYFYQGLDKLNKESDMAYIIKQIRIMRYFLKTVLSKDQRVLLKLKGTENVPSETDKPNPMLFKKKLKKDVLLDRYIECVQHKEINE
jgi:hypothetical protein